MEAPSSKLQAPEKLQARSSKGRLGGCLKFGDRSFSGAWSLELGAFTLIELILVMTLLAAVMSVVAPSLSSFFRGRTLDCEARRLLALTRHGHERAIADGFPVVLWIDSARQAYGLQAENGFEEQDSKALRMDLDKDLRIEVTETTATVARQLNGSLGNLPAIRFLPDGSVDEASPTEIRLQDRTGMMVVRQIRPPSRSDSRIRSSPNAIYEIQRQNTIWSR